MDVIYNWLLHNTGNEGNYLTILNVQPHKEGEEITEMDVMARTKNFEIVNLSVKSRPNSAEAGPIERKTIEKAYHFDKADQLITYLSDGQEPNSSTESGEAALYVSVVKPSGNAGDISFPPQS